MSISSPTSLALLYEGDTKSKVLPGNISPIIESSSTATLESTTAQVSSKSSSPLSTANINHQETTKASSLQFSLSPLSTSLASSPFAGQQQSPFSPASTTSNLKNVAATLSSRFSPSRSPSESITSRSQHWQKTHCFTDIFQTEIRKEARSALLLHQQFMSEANMLTPTSTSLVTSISQQSNPTTTSTSTAAAIATSTTLNSPTATAATSVSSLSPTAATVIGCQISNNSNNTGVQSIKCETHLTTSPTGGLGTSENSSSQQRQMEETASKINSGTGSDSLHGGRDVSSAMQRKNSNGVIISGAGLHASPTLSSNNNNDNSNSSNSTISQLMDVAEVSSSNGQQQQQSQETKSNNVNKVVSKTCNADDANDDNGNINTSASGNFINAQCTSKENSSSSTSSSSSISSSASTKDEVEMQAVLGNLGNVKKEQGNVDTPEMSPDGFGSLSTLSANNTGVGASSGTPATSINDMLVNAGNNNIILGRNSNNTNNNNNKSSNMIGGTGCMSHLLNDETSNGQQSLNHNNNNFGSNISIMSTGSMDYMQQQNHIFVFSTQLANKGAESVLSGQFPTIIAYHCTQPATKKFLEDFFLKNPMKMAKIQRQNTLNMAISVSAASHQWISSGTGGVTTNSTKNSQKLNGRSHIGSANAINNQICNNSGLDDKSASATSNAGFSDTTNPLSAEAADLMSWEQTNISLDNIASNSNTGHSIKMSETSDAIVGSPHNNSGISATSITQSPNKPIGIIGNANAPVSPNDGLQPSLQGVKVPDENLTPQQRQHREEQLAKIKKMNQFLFPEHGSDMLPDAGSLQASNQLGKINADGIIGNNPASTTLAGMLGDSSSSSPGTSSAGNQIASSRGSANMIGMGRASTAMVRNSLNLNAGQSEDTGIPTGIISGPGDIASMHCGNQSTVPSNLIINSQQGLPCTQGGLLSAMGPNALVGGNHQGAMLSHGSMVSSSISSIQNCGSSGAPSSGIMLQGGPPKGGMGGTNQLDIGSGPSSQIEWSKMQQQFYEERTTKSNKNGPDVMSGLCRSLSTVGGGPYARSAQPGVNANSSAINASGPNVRSQGPPPPYHPTQRSASVPIATQSPNPASPNNPTSNLSLPSPRTASGTCGTNLNSPSSDNLVSAASVTTPTTSVGMTINLSAATSTANSQCKAFQQEDSPTGQNSSGLVGSTNNLRNNLNQFNSNPSTPLSNMSPKDLENIGTSVTDSKNPRPSPQRSRTPHVNSNNSADSTNIESRFPPVSPGISFPTHLQNQTSGSKISIGSNENSTQATFGRRPDNLPLNPNSSRSAPIKQNLHFDPISSLAQMSQQLTSCVSSNGGVSGPTSVGINSSMSSEMAASQNMEGLLGQSVPMDSGIDHCSNVPGGSVGMGLPPHMLGGGQYGPGNCHMGSPIINPMGSRLLAPKMGPGFSGAGPGTMREGPAGFHGGMPSHRMMGRMGVSFCPFNGSPNIQVKASTPNTIQYMPVRPQTSNTNPRVPPSLEFLQRFANPQLAVSPNMDGQMMGSGNGGNADIIKMGNAPLSASMQNAGMSFFPNCNQIGGGSGSGNGVNNQVDMAAVMMPGHSDIGGVMNIGNPTGGMNIRGMRPIRQGSMGPGGSPIGGMPHRMQGPGAHIIGGPGNINQFGNNSHEAMDCVNTTDPSGMFGNAPSGSNQIFGQQKGSPMGGQTHCQNMSPGNVGINGPVGNTGVGTNEQGSPMQAQLNGPGMLGPNSSVPLVGGNGLVSASVSGSPNNGPGNYKSYIGPSTNDLKYAQQYHNFQQQLYATSTRSQISQQMGGSPAMGLSGGVPTNGNSGFFVSK